jgi:hypothetical protein
VIGLPLLESKVMRDSKNPAAKIMARPSKVYMPKKCQEDFLDHFFAVVNGQAQRQRVTEKTITETVE